MLGAPSRLGILAGYGVAALIRAVIVGALLFAVALATGMQITGGGVDLFGLIGLAAIVNVTATAVRGGRGVPHRGRSRPARRCRCRCSSCSSSRPSTCRSTCCRAGSHAVAQVNPFTALVEGGRDLISGQDFPALLAYGLALAMALLFSVWAVRGLRRAEAAG